VKVDTDRFIIGRGPHCNMVIDSPRVSREHVALTRKGVLFLLEDLNSSNGTWLGEERIGLRELETGDVIKLGNEPVTFVIRAD
jgi:pSer/pThr/pTyr-binding forkhead associated (FHA) protein